MPVCENTRAVSLLPIESRETAEQASEIQGETVGIVRARSLLHPLLLRYSFSARQFL